MPISVIHFPPRLLDCPRIRMLNFTGFFIFAQEFFDPINSVRQYQICIIQPYSLFVSVTT